MARAENTELIDSFEEFYRDYYRNEIGELAQKYPTEQKSLYIDWDDLYRFDPDLADDYRNQPDQLQEYAEEALRLYDLPVDVKLGQAHVRVHNLPESTDIREIRADHRGNLISVRGIVRKATDVRPKITTAAFECQRCGTLTRIPQQTGDFQEPHECQGCERQGPFRVNFDQSEFVDAQKIRVQESPEGLRGGETPQSIDVNIEDDITGEVTAGDHVRVTGILQLDQQGDDRSKSPMFDVYMDGIDVTIEDEQFEDMDITEQDKRDIIELSNEDGLYEKMVGAIAPSIYGYDQEKLTMILQLFSGVTKHLPDESRIRGDLHMLLIGDPGTGKCVAGDTRVTRADGSVVPIRDLVEENLDEPRAVDDGVWDSADFEVPSLQDDGTIEPQRATKVWKREAPDRLYRIRTSTGRELDVTPSHPLFVQSDGRFEAVRAEDLSEGEFVAVPRRVPTAGQTVMDVIPDIGTELRRIRNALGLTQHDCGIPRSTYQHYESGSRNPSRESLSSVLRAFESRLDELATGDGPDAEAHADGGGLDALRRDLEAIGALVDGDTRWDRIESIEPIDPDDEWVYDLEIEGTHNYLTNGVISHNSQMLSYIQNIAPRSVYTSGKGSSSAGLTAAAVRDDFGEGQQWTLEAGALVLADQGIAAVDELDKMRCVTGDTLVHFGDRVTRIDDFARGAAESGTVERLPNGRTIRGIDATAWTVTDDGSLVERPVTAVHEYDAPEELYRVRLETGERLTGTADHPFFVFENGERIEKAASDLEPDDWLYVPRHVQSTAADGGTTALEAPETGSTGRGADTEGGDLSDEANVSPPFGAVLGYLAGDGNVFYDQSEGVYGLRFTNAEEQLLADFERACRDAFGAEPVRPPSEQRADGVETVRLHGREYADAVLDAGMNLQTYEGKRLPEAVSRSSRATKAAFLRALADSEGTVEERNLRLFSSSYDLLVGAKHLLLEFGITSQIQTRTQDDKRDVYVLVVTESDSLAAFASEIGFTLDRKQAALNDAVERVTGTRTIVDVIPDCDEVLAETRTSLRLQQSECGINDATYCNFESGEANLSFLKGREILAAFEERRRTAREDLDAIADNPNWETLARLRTAYHVSQSEIAEPTVYSQQQVSYWWGKDDELRETVQARLVKMVETVAETDLTRLRRLVYGDVKWRRVESVEPVTSADAGDRVRVQRERLATLLDCSVDDALERGRELLRTDPALDSWDAVREALSAYGVSLTAIADDLHVDQSTVSRWSRGAVETDRFADVRSAARDRIDEVRADIESLVADIEERRRPKVYDLTVEGTHNFVANGMIVHNSEDRSAMHQALEQQEISVSKAGINATLKSRCSLLGAANPKYGRFDQYEPISEQIDLEPALISRFDLIFTVTDQPDEEEDRKLAEHILTTNYAGELNTHRVETNASDYSAEEVENVTEEVAPTIQPDLLRKYIAYSKRNCFPTMTEEARDEIKEFYASLRAQGQDEDAPVPVTARKLEALVRLAEASARVRLSDTVTKSDAQRVIEIVRSSMEAIGVDPETGELDADIIEAGTSKSQRDRIKNIKHLVDELESEYDEGAPVDVVIERAEEAGMEASKAEHEIEKLKQKGEVYEPQTDHLRTT